MNAVKLYVSTARLVLENEQFDYSLCKAINSSLASLELSLTCTVCRSLLTEPHSPVDSTCQHHVCRDCLGGHKKLKPSCSWCKDYASYARNTQLHCLLACYRGLCHYIKCSRLLAQLADLGSLADHEKRVLAIVNRGAQPPSGRGDGGDRREAKLKIDLYEVAPSARRRDGGDLGCRFRRSVERHRRDSSAISSEDEPSCGADASRAKSEYASAAVAEKSPRIDPDDKTDTHTLRLRRITGGVNHNGRDSVNNNNSSEDSAASDDAESRPLYSVAFASTRSKLILKRRNVPLRREANRPKTGRQLPAAVSYSLRTPDYLQNRSSIERNEKGRFRKLKHKSNHPIRPACRCGIAASRPGKLTCCGQRCVCYMQKKACSTCRCRGCRNPHLIDGVKILGKFLKSNNRGETKLIASSPASYLNSSSTACINQVLPSLPTSSSVMDIS